jgi:hypothetical protein
VTEQRARPRGAYREKRGADPLSHMGELAWNGRARRSPAEPPDRVRGRAAGAARGKMRMSSTEAAERGCAGRESAGAPLLRAYRGTCMVEVQLESSGHAGARG